jgi:hypothetical protein
MTSMLLVFSLLFNHPVQADSSLTEMRRLYQSAAVSEDSLKKLAMLLAPANNNSATMVYLGYKGAATIMQAKYQVNPFSKLESLKKGKEILQTAIIKDTTQLETRYLRFTIQTNLPSFLNYSADINNDKLFLLSNYRSIQDEELKKMVFQYLSTSKFCTEEELKKIKN